MDAEKYLDKLAETAEKKGAVPYGINYSESESCNISVLNQEVLQNSSKLVRNVDFSVLKNGKTGKASAERLDENDISYLVDEALVNASLLENEEKFFMYDGSGKYPEAKSFQPLTAKLETLDKTEYLKTAERKAYELDSRVANVVSAAFYSSRTVLNMKNSLGLDVGTDWHYAGAHLQVRVKDGDKFRTGGYRVCFGREEDFDPEYLAAKAVEEALRHAGAVSAVSGKPCAVFENHVFAEFLSAIAPIFSAFEADNKRSKLAGKVGEIVASELVTIVDDPLLENGLGTMAFDYEGVPAKRKEVVKNGKLETLLHNLSTADKHGVETTANGSGGLGTKVFNFYVQKGEISKEELLKQVDGGIYITGFNGLFCGINRISGDFSVGAEGIKIENGKLSRPLEQFTVSGNIYRLLQDVCGVADDLDFYCSKFGSPTVAVNGLTIAA